MVMNSHQESFSKVISSSENAIFFKLSLFAVMNWFQWNTSGKISKEERTSEIPE